MPSRALNILQVADAQSSDGQLQGSPSSSQESALTVDLGDIAKHQKEVGVAPESANLPTVWIQESPPIVPAPISSEEFEKLLAKARDRYGDFWGLSRTDLIYARDTLVRENQDPKMLRTIDITMKHFDFLQGLGNPTKDHGHIRTAGIQYTSKILHNESFALTKAYMDKRTNDNATGLGVVTGSFVGMVWMCNSQMYPLIPIGLSLGGGWALGRIVDRVYTTGEAVYEGRSKAQALRREFSDSSELSGSK